MQITINIAMAINDAYVRYAYVAILSILANKKLDEGVRFFILHTDVSEVSRDLLLGMVTEYQSTVEFIYIDKEQIPSELPVREKWPAEIYYRLMLAQVLPLDIERVLYLDADIIVNDSLAEIYNVEFEENYICACEDFWKFTENDARSIAIINNVRQGLPYICSGIILFNLSGLRNNRYSFEFFVDAARKMQYQLLTPDQDIINFVFASKIKVIDKYKYNFVAGLAYSEGINYDEAKRTAIIVHFSQQKPWQGGAVHYDTQQLWWDYAKKTPFYMEFLEEYVSESIGDPYIYNMINKYLAEKQELQTELKHCREELALRTELNERLLAILEGGGYVGEKNSSNRRR